MEFNIILAFGAGIASFFAPCMVPLLPGYIAYITGVTSKELIQSKPHSYHLNQLILPTLLYIVGFSLIFVLLGSSAAWLGKWVLINRGLLQTGGGLIIIIFGLQMLGVIQIHKLQQEWRFELPGWIKAAKFLRPFLLGVVFATAWTPCVGPILGTILTLAAATQTVWQGAGLLLVYSLGISLPFLVITILLAYVPDLLKGIGKYLATINSVSGLILIMLGILLFNNQLKLVSPLITYDALNRYFFQIFYHWGY